MSQESLISNNVLSGQRLQLFTKKEVIQLDAISTE